MEALILLLIFVASISLCCLISLALAQLSSHHRHDLTDK
jgi:hypothetical protein